MKLYTKQHSNWLLLGIMLIGTVLRLYKLDSIPAGLYQDETAIGYNAYSILETGKDEHGVTLPLYFKSFGDYKLPVYMYLTAVSEALLGINPFAVRITSALFGIAAIICLYLTVKQLFSTSIALASSLMLALNPWHIFFSRAAMEVNVATTVSLMGLLCLLIARKKQSILLILVSMILFLVSSYTYNVYRLLGPLLFVCFSILFLKDYRRVTPVVLYGVFLLFAILLAPLFISFFSGTVFTHQQTEFITGGHTFARILEFKSYVFENTPELSKIFFNKWFLFAWEYMKNLIGFFSVNFFFLTGDEEGHFGTGNTGMFHLIEVLFIPTALVVLIQKKIRSAQPFLLWALITILLVSLTKETPHATRSFALVVPMSMFSGYGLVWFWQLLRTIRVPWLRYGSIIGLFSLYLYSIVFFLVSYFFRFSAVYARQWRVADRALVTYLSEIQSNYERIVIDKKVDLAYTSLLFYVPISPGAFHRNQHFEPDGQLLQLVATNPYEFRPVIWEREQLDKKTLYVSHPSLVPAGIAPIKTIVYPTRPIVVFFDGKFGQYPITDIAFGLYELGNK
ncbi:glycosyltransferase family 39 protein [Candidatus Roizmanbacteria bacterium]|nr:glycosyltransferase family 39 protein [Candidatus Roizmanbacteria bacterium]